MMQEEEARCETLRNPEKYCVMSHVVNSLKVAKLMDVTENTDGFVSAEVIVTSRSLTFAVEYR